MLPLLASPDTDASSSLDARALLRMRYEAAPRALVRREEAALLEKYSSEGIRLEVVHPRWWSQPLAAATLPLGADARPHITLFEMDIPLQYLHPRPLPAAEWAKCCVLVRFGGAIVWCVPLCAQQRDAFATAVPNCTYYVNAGGRPAYERRYWQMLMVEPSAPLFRATENEERWQFAMKGGAAMAHELPVWRLGGHRACHSELLALVRLDCAYPASALQPPLSRIEQDEVAAADPLRLEAVTRNFFEPGAVSTFPTRYSLLKGVDVVAKTREWEWQPASYYPLQAPLPHPPPALAERFRASAVLFEVQDPEYGRLLASHLAPTLVDPERPNWVPPVFGAPTGAPLDWTEGFGTLLNGGRPRSTTGTGAAASTPSRATFTLRPYITRLRPASRCMCASCSMATCRQPSRTRRRRTRTVTLFRCAIPGGSCSAWTSVPLAPAMRTAWPMMMSWSKGAT